MRLTVATMLLVGVAGLAMTSGQESVDIRRFQQVDDKLYRGAQPDARGFEQLRDLGIRTIINLRLEEDAIETDEQRIVEGLGMRYVNVPVSDGNFFTWFRRIPEDSVRQFFAALDADPGPAFVHCRRGTDRTGAMVAFYRIARNGWQSSEARSEAGEVGMRFWYRGLRRQISAFEPAQLGVPGS